MKFLCWLLGHKAVSVIEFRYRKSRKLYQFGGYQACKRCGKKFTNWEPMWASELPHHYMWATKEDAEKYMKELDLYNNLYVRGVAQLVSVPVLGTGGPPFEPEHPDKLVDSSIG